MHDMGDEDRKQILGKVLMDELKAIREYLENIPAIKSDVQELKVDVEELKSDVKVIKAAVTDQSKQLANHETRITVLENAA